MATKQRLYPLQNCHFGSKIKNGKEHAENNSISHCSCSIQKTAPKNNQYSKNETILKIGKNGHKAKAAIAFAKWSLWVKN